MCFGIRISSPFHLATQIITFQNIKCAKNADNAAKTWFLIRKFCSAKTSLSSSFVTFFFNKKCYILLSVYKCYSTTCTICPWTEYIFNTLIMQLHFWSLICRVDTAQASLKLGWPCMRFFFAFLSRFRFWKDIIWMTRWNRLEILIPKHMWKSKIGLLEQIWGQNPYDTFFWVTL